ncbi:MAG: TolC family protein [Syntrophales bacterium]
MQDRKFCFVAAVLLSSMMIFCPVVFAADRDQVLTLRESIRIALAHNATIHSAAEGVKASESKRKEAMTGFFPKLSTYYSYQRLNEPPEIKGLPIGTGTVVTGTQDNYNWALELRQPVFAGGGILANYQINRIESSISRLDEMTTTQDIIQEVEVSYFTILKALKIRDVAAQSVEQLKAHRDVARNFFDVGMIPKNDLLNSEVQLANGQQYLLRAENDVELAKAQFNTVLRRGLNSPVVVEDILAYKPFQRDLADCLKTAMDNRPEAKSYSLRVEQAGKSVDLARSEFFPSISLIGNYSKYGDTPELAGSRFSNSEFWYVMAQANWNIWEWGRTKYKVDASLSRKSQAADALTNILDRIALEVKNAYLLLKEAEKRIVVAGKAIEQAEENFRINQERYKEHVATSTDVIDAQTLLTRAKSDYFNALSDYNIAMARLERSMGTIYASVNKE